MFECKFCGHSSDNPRARFCSECGPQGPAVGWKVDEVDTFDNLAKYTEVVGSLPTMMGGTALDDRTASMRVKFKISYAAHRFIADRLFGGQAEPAISEKLSVSYNANFTEAYAGHDTFIEFKLENKTEDNFYKARLEWDDLETEDRIDLQASIDRFIVPGESRQIGTTVIFDRAGLKELVGLKLDLIDEAGVESSYEMHPLRVRVTNPAVNIHNSYTQSNSISIEGRGVVDAQGLGSSAAHTHNNSEGDRWLELRLTPFIDSAEIAGDALKFITPKHTVRNDTEESEPVDIEETREPEALKVEANGSEEAVHKAPLDLSSVSLSLQSSAASSFSHLVLDTATGDDSIAVEFETLCEPGTFIRRDSTPILKVISAGESKTLSSPIDGIFQFVNESDSAKLDGQWCAAVTVIEGGRLEIKACLREGSVLIEDIPYGMEVSISTIQASITETGVVGTAYCLAFDRELEIVLDGASALVGTPLESRLEAGETILGSPDVRDDSDEQGTRIAEVHRHQFFFECASLKDYLATDSIEIATVHVDRKRISSAGEALFFVKAGGVQYTVISRFPAQLSSVFDRAKPNCLEISLFCAPSESQSLLTVKDPRNGAAFLTLSECNSVEDHYIDIGSPPANLQDLSFKYSAKVGSDIAFDEAIGEIETDKCVVELSSQLDGILGYVRPSGLKTGHTLVYELITAGSEAIAHRYHYRCAEESSTEECELVSIGENTAADVVENSISGAPAEALKKKRGSAGLWLLAVTVVVVGLIWIAQSSSRNEQVGKTKSSDESVDDQIQEFEPVTQSFRAEIPEVEKREQEALAMIAKAVALHKKQKYEDAEKILRRSIAIYELPKAYEWLGYFKEEGLIGSPSLIDAKRYYEKAIALSDGQNQWAEDRLASINLMQGSSEYDNEVLNSKRISNIDFLPRGVQRQAERMFGLTIDSDTRVRDRVLYRNYISRLELTPGQVMELYDFYNIEAKDYGVSSLIAYEAAKRFNIWKAWGELAWSIREGYAANSLGSEERMRLEAYAYWQAFKGRQIEGVSTSYPKSQLNRLGYDVENELTVALLETEDKKRFFETLKNNSYW